MNKAKKINSRRGGSFDGFLKEEGIYSNVVGPGGKGNSRVEIAIGDEGKESDGVGTGQKNAHQPGCR